MNTSKQSTMTRLNNVHPGEVLSEEFMKPLGITAYRVSKATKIQSTALGQIINGKRSISTDVAIRLGRFFMVTPQFWLNLQQMFDLEQGERDPARVALYDQIVGYETTAQHCHTD